MIAHAPACRRAITRSLVRLPDFLGQRDEDALRAADVTHCRAESTREALLAKVQKPQVRRRMKTAFAASARQRAAAAKISKWRVD